MPHGRVPTAAVEEEASVVVALVADMPEAAEALEQAATEVESVSAEPASLHLGIHHMGGLSIPVQQAEW